MVLALWMGSAVSTDMEARLLGRREPHPPSAHALRSRAGSGALRSHPVWNKTHSSSSSSSTRGAMRSDNQTGVYLTAQSIRRKDFLDETMQALLKAKGSALVFDVKGGIVFFHSAAPVANDIGLVKPFYDLPEVLRQAKARGLYTIGRFVAIKDEPFTAKKPNTRPKDPRTGRVMSATWVDPANDEAIQYNSEIVCELAAAGIDEINLDYIRFSTADVGALRALSGKEKADHLEKFIRAVRETINRCGPNTKLGISTFAILGWDYAINMETLGQDVVRFAPLVDVISPMAYPNTFAPGHYYNPAKHPRSRMYYLVYRTLTGYKDLLGPEQSKKLRPWIQGYSVKQKDMTEQIDAVYDAGLCGFQVWNADNVYKETFKAMDISTTRPSHCQS
jgi:hypothetical protein